MKKIILSCTVLLTLLSCSKSPEAQAEENIKNYITQKLDDPKSYESVSFGKLDNYTAELKDDPEFIKLYTEFDKASKLEVDAYAQTLENTDNERIVQLSSEIYKSRQDSAKIALDAVQKYKANYKPGEMFKMSHKFRAKNKMGALVLDSCQAILNKDLSVDYLK